MYFLCDYWPQTLAFIGLVSKLTRFPAWKDQAQAVATVLLNGDDRSDHAAEESDHARYNILRRLSESNLCIAEQ